MNATTDTFSQRLREGIERNARRVVFDHLLSGSLPDPLIDNFKRLLLYGSTPTDRWESLAELIPLFPQTPTDENFVLWENIDVSQGPLMINIDVRKPNGMRLSLP